jgi:hypothetical protein
LLDRWRLIDYRHPIEPFSRHVVTFFPLLPEHEGEWIEFAEIGPTGEPLRLKLIDHGAAGEPGSKIRRIAAVCDAGTKRERTLSFMIDSASFNAGEGPQRFVVSESLPEGEIKEQGDAFLLGLPTLRAYRRENVRYLKTPLRHDAFTCRKAAAQVVVDDPKFGRTYVHRIEVWLTGAVPFGVLQIEQTVRDDETDELVSVRRLTAVATNRPLPEHSSRAAMVGESEVDGLNIPAN